MSAPSSLADIVADWIASKLLVLEGADADAIVIALRTSGRVSPFVDRDLVLAAVRRLRAICDGILARES